MAAGSERDRPPAAAPGPAAASASAGSPFAVVVCTRNRPAQVAETLDALVACEGPPFPIVVVDQSDETDPELARREAAEERLSVIHDSGRGLSRARNAAWRSTHTEWIVFVDDDCIVERDWARALAQELAAHPEADFVSGHVAEGRSPSDDYVPQACFPVEAPAVLSGRWTRPDHIGFGVCMAVRRERIEALGGWDERLGAGTRDFPAGEDVDFNYRLLRAGGVAYLTPRVRSRHEQWRTEAELPAHLRGYAAGGAGFAIKHLRQGDIAGGLWLYAWNFRDLAFELARALKRRSWLRLKIVLWRVGGVLSGTVRALGRSW